MCKTIVLLHGLNLHFASLVTWVHVYFTDGKKAEQEAEKQARQGRRREVTARAIGKGVRNQRSPSVLTIRSGGPPGPHHQQ